MLVAMLVWVVENWQRWCAALVGSLLERLPYWELNIKVVTSWLLMWRKKGGRIHHCTHLTASSPWLSVTPVARDLCSECRSSLSHRAWVWEQPHKTQQEFLLCPGESWKEQKLSVLVSLSGVSSVWSDWVSLWVQLEVPLMTVNRNVKKIINTHTKYKWEMRKEWEMVSRSRTSR